MSATKRDSKAEYIKEIKSLMEQNDYLYKKYVATDLYNDNLNNRLAICWIIIIVLAVLLCLAIVKLLWMCN